MRSMNALVIVLILLSRSVKSVNLIGSYEVT